MGKAAEEERHKGFVERDHLSSEKGWWLNRPTADSICSAARDSGSGVREQAAQSLP